MSLPSSWVVDLRLETRTYTISNMMAEMVFLLITVETQSLVHSGHSINKCDYKSIPAQWNFCYDVYWGIWKNIQRFNFFKKQDWGFPGGAVVENLPANAGDTGSSPALGGSHMPWGDWACEPQLLSLRVCSLCSATRGRDSERPAHRDEEWPPLAATRESPRTETKTQHSHK